MFFDMVALAPRRGAVLRRPPIPETGWRPPTEFPNLESAVAIGIDTESKDLGFKDHGPGWRRGSSHIVGFSVAAVDRYGNTGKWYYPLRHEVEPEYNCDVQSCLGWLAHVASSRVPKVFANAIIDIGTLAAERVYVHGRIDDVQFAEALIDEDAFVALDVLGSKYLGRGKTSEAYSEWSRDAYGGGTDQRGNLYRCSPRLVGPYGEDDALLPLQILPRQWPELERQELLTVYELEVRLIPLILRMCAVGVRVDIDAAVRLRQELQADVRVAYAKLANVSGISIDSVSAASQVARCFDNVGLRYPTTPEGSPSFRKEWLKEQLNPVADCINEIRELEKLDGTFVGSYILEGHINGRLYTQFHPLRNDENGAKTGRFSSSTPNLQNIPARTKQGKKIRYLMLPEIGHLGWRKRDHSQIEYRMLANFAVGPGASELRNEYCSNPATDYHQRVFVRWCADMGLDIATMDKDEVTTRRRPIKNINFGLVFGQTQKSLAYKAGMTDAQAAVFFPAYHEAAPYVRPTMEAIGNEVQALGYITTILGRRTRFEFWEPIRSRGEKSPRQPAVYGYQNALNLYGMNIQRAFAYRGTNYRFQGSAADCLKDGMLACYEAGIFDVTGVPMLTVHDELDFSVIDDGALQREAYREMLHLLENPPRVAPRLAIPLKVDTDDGATWGACK